MKKINTDTQQFQPKHNFSQQKLLQKTSYLKNLQFLNSSWVNEKVTNEILIRNKPQMKALHNLNDPAFYS